MNPTKYLAFVLAIGIIGIVATIAAAVVLSNHPEANADPFIRDIIIFAAYGFLGALFVSLIVWRRWRMSKLREHRKSEHETESNQSDKLIQ